MKIYTSRKVPDEEYSELEYYIEKICNKDVWLALREDDLYYKWIRAYRNGSYLTFSSIHNSAYYTKEYFYNDGDYSINKDLLAVDINLDNCEVVHPVMMLSTEELSDYISSPHSRFTFNFVEDDY